MEIIGKYHRDPIGIFVDECDLELVNKYEWTVTRIHNRLYAVKNILGKTTYMHQLIMNAPRGMEVDHIDRNGLNNQRDNLRIVTHAENIRNTAMFSHNTSGYRGVVWFREGWRAQIKHNGSPLQSGYFVDPKRAALLRDELARKLFGEGTYLNLPGEEPDEAIVKQAIRMLSKRNWITI